MRLAELARAHGLEGVTYRSSVLTEEVWERLLSESEETFLTARNSVVAFCRASSPPATEVVATSHLLSKVLEVKLNDTCQPSPNRAPQVTTDILTIYCIFLLAASTQPNEGPILSIIMRHFTRITEIAMAARKRTPSDASLEAAASLLASALINALAHEQPNFSNLSLARVVRASMRAPGELSEEVVRSNRTVLEWLIKSQSQTDVPLSDCLTPLIATEFAQLSSKQTDFGAIDRLTKSDWPSLLNTRDSHLALISLVAATAVDKEIPLKLDITVTLIRAVLARLGLSETPPSIRERDLVKARQKLSLSIPTELPNQINALVLYVQRMAQQNFNTVIAKTLHQLAHIVRFSAVAQIDVRENVISAAERLVAASGESEIGSTSEMLEKAIVYLLGSLRTGHTHLSLIRFGRTLYQTMGPQLSSPIKFVTVSTAYFDLLADALSAGAREAPTHSEALRKARHQAVLNLQDLLQAFVLTCKDLAASAATTQSLADIGEGMENETRDAHSKGMGSLLSCFGTEIIFGLKLCKLDPLNSAIDKKFLIASGMWILESFQYTQGGLDLSTYFSFFQGIGDRLCQKVKLLRETRMRERTVEKSSLELLFEAVATQLEESLSHFCYYPADIDFLHEHEEIVSRLLSSDYTLDKVPGVATALGRLLKSLSNSPDRQARPILDKIWRPIRDWAEKASQSQVSEAGRNLLHVVASTIPPECIFELASHLLMSVARSPSAETREVFLDLTSIAVEAAAGHREICSSLEIILKAAIEQLAQNSTTPRGWYHLISSLLVVFDSCQIALESQTSVIMQVIAQSRENTPTVLWKTRLQFHTAFLAHLLMLWESNRILDDASRNTVVTYLLQVPFYEACWKCSSMTGVTRRRAYRTLEIASDLILRILGPNEGSREISRILLCGLSVVECPEFQRGFVVAGEKLLAMESLRFSSAFRNVVDEVLSVSRGLCHNLDRRSSRSSTKGSRMSKSTRFTTSRSIKSQYNRSRKA